MKDARTTEDRTHTPSRRFGLAAAGVALGVVALGLVAFLAMGNLLAASTDDEQRVTDVAELAVPEDVYREITLGIDKEALTERLLPARPVDTRVLERYQSRSPETVASSCVYYEADSRNADSLYRFCFEDDRLVDKTVVLPDDQLVR